MKNTIRICILMFGLVFFLAGAAGAQLSLRPRGSGGWGPGSNYSKLYDPKTVETIKGQVMGLEELLPSKDMLKGVSMTVKTGKGEILPVHLGPQWYLENQDFELKTGDLVEVRGSRITFNGKPAVIAQEVVQAGLKRLRLRDDNGNPVWSALVQ